MKISIITTCYNRVNTIERTILSVLEQDYNDIEYIVVDGASTDGSMDVINKYSDRINKIISEPDTGMYEAINKGILLCTGDIIGLLHSDDEFLSPQVLTHIAQSFKHKDADLVYANGLFISYKNGKTVRNWRSGEYSRKKLKFGWLPLHTTVFLKKSVYEKYGLYDLSYRIAADSDMLVRLLYVHNLKICYIDKYVVRMKMGGLSTLLRTQFQKTMEDYRIYSSCGFPFSQGTVFAKICSKVPQFAIGFYARIKKH